MDIEHVLTSIPPVTENIFKFLNGRDLSACAQVCSVWNQLAGTEKKRRLDILWFFQGLHCTIHDQIRAGCRECALDVSTEIESDVTAQLGSLRMQPGFCITFASTGFVDSFDRLFPSFHYFRHPYRKRMRYDVLLKRRGYLTAVLKKFRRYFPRECDISFCGAPGIIGCNEDTVPHEIEEGCAVGGILLPKMDGLEIHRISIDGQKTKVSEMIPDETSIKCLLVFLTQRGTSYTNRVIQNCLLKEECKVAVGGAIVDRTESLVGSVLAIGGPRVKAASVVIKPKDKKKDLVNKLKLFKDTGLLEHRCFAFMFACVARGYYIYREYNLESSIFHKMYPRVPLFGVFGNGEIGINYFPHLPTENKVLQIGKLVHCTKRYLHSYSTVFVMVSIKF